MEKYNIAYIKLWGRHPKIWEVGCVRCKKDVIGREKCELIKPTIEGMIVKSGIGSYDDINKALENVKKLIEVI